MGALDAINNAWSYVAGQCTAFVARMAPWIPPGLGNAGQWLANAQAQGFQISSSPSVGAVAVYGGGQGYSDLGHVAIVTGLNADGTFQVEEDNATYGPNHPDYRVSSMRGVAGFILPPAGAGSLLLSPGPGIPNYNPAAPGTGNPSIPGNAPNPPSFGVPAVSQAINAATASIGHGLANAGAALGTDAGVFVRRNAVALFVAVVVTYILFGGLMGGAPQQG